MIVRAGARERGLTPVEVLISIGIAAISAMNTGARPMTMLKATSATRSRSGSTRPMTMSDLRRPAFTPLPDSRAGGRRG